MRIHPLAFAIALGLGAAVSPSGCGSSGDPCVSFCEEGMGCSEDFSENFMGTDCASFCADARAEAADASCDSEIGEYFDCLGGVDACTWLAEAQTEQGPSECAAEAIGYAFCLF